VIEVKENKILGTSEGYSYFVDGQGLVVDKNSWNAAIEAAAEYVDDLPDSEDAKAFEIRKLKK